MEHSVSLSMNFGVSPALTTLSLHAMHSTTSVTGRGRREGRERERERVIEGAVTYFIAATNYHPKQILRVLISKQFCSL